MGSGSPIDCVAATSDWESVTGPNTLQWRSIYINALPLPRMSGCQLSCCLLVLLCDAACRLKEEPCSDYCVHLWCSPCAVCQEVRPTVTVAHSIHACLCFGGTVPAYGAVPQL